MELHGNLDGGGILEGGTSECVESVNIREYWGHRHVVTAIAVFPLGDRVVTGDGHGRVRVFEKESKQLVGYIRAHNKHHVCCLHVSPDRKFIASAGLDDLIQLIDAGTHEIVKTFKGHKRQILDLKFSNCAQFLCSTGWDNKAVLWNVSKLSKQAVLKFHMKPVSCCAFSYKNNILATGSWDFSVRAYPLDKLTPASPPPRRLQEEDITILTHHKSKVTCIAFSRAGMMGTGSYDGQVYIYHYRGLYLLAHLDPQGGWLRSLAFSHDSLLLATVSDDDYIVRVWDAVTRELEEEIPIKAEDLLLCSFLPNGKLVAAGSLM